MSAILLQQSIALVPLRDGVIGAFFHGIENYRSQYPTSADSIVLSNGVRILGLEIIAPSDSNLVNQVRLYYVPTEADNWRPRLGSIGGRTFNEGPTRLVSETLEYKVATLPLDSPVPVNPGIATLLLS